ncbi:hypothetical protein RBB50_002223 [Rhinocladiella similis]
METWAFDHVHRGDAQYEQIRRRCVWNGAVPPRFPEWIVFPEDSQQIRQIVLFAKWKKMRIGVKSGGHSWSAAFLQDGGILIDMVKMKRFTYNTKARTAEVEPAVYASELNSALLDHKLMFPAGHCPTVGMGGFLLQGGLGWNAGNWGIACESILAMDLVTADGEILHASSSQNSEYFWAARGSGCGFFAVVTRFYVQLHPTPPGIMMTRHVFEIENLNEVLTAIDSVSAQASLDLEIGMFIAHDQDGFIGRPTLAISIYAFSKTEDEAKAALEFIHNLAPFRKAIKFYGFVPCTLREMMQRLAELLDNRGRHYHVDNMWTDAPVQSLLPSFHKIIKKLPPAPSHLYMTWWPARSRPDMAYSIEGRLYVAMYAISSDPSTDTVYAKYVEESIQMMKQYEKGVQLGDENLPSHPGRFMSTEGYTRLEQLRKRLDPDVRFYSYMRVPDEFLGCKALI